MPVLSLEYVAGLFDAEGSVFIGLRKNRKYHLGVTVSNKNPRPLHYLLKQFGGYIHKKKTVWLWETARQGALVFLMKIYPFCTVKANVVWLGICYQEHVNEYTLTKGSPYTNISEGERSMRNETRRMLTMENAMPSAHYRPDTRLSTRYLAGFFDGEGSISILYMSSYSFALTVTVTNGSTPILQALKRMFGGTFCRRPESQWENWPVYAWQSSHRIAFRFLEEIYPYLIIKSTVAWIGLCFQRHKWAYMVEHGANAHISDKEKEARLAAREIVMKMNDRWKKEPVGPHARKCHCRLHSGLRGSQQPVPA